MLSFNKFEKKYQQELVLSIPDLKLTSGVYWLKGENGSGKSTLLYAIAGMIPFNGTIALDEPIDVRNNQEKYRLLVNHADAEPLFPEFLSGDELTAFYLKLKNGNKEQLNALSEKLKLSSYAHRKTSEYSSGMLKRLALVLAFIGSPRLILLDEPLTTLDADTQKNLLELISEYAKKGVAFLITSHQEFRLPDDTQDVQVLEVIDKKLKGTDKNVEHV